MWACVCARSILYPNGNCWLNLCITMQHSTVRGDDVPVTYVKCTAILVMHRLWPWPLMHDVGLQEMQCWKYTTIRPFDISLINFSRTDWIDCRKVLQNWIMNNKIIAARICSLLCKWWLMQRLSFSFVFMFTLWKWTLYIYSSIVLWMCVFFSPFVIGHAMVGLTICLAKKENSFKTR